MIVFVSHSSTNREAVEALVLQLGQLGYDVDYEIKFVGAPLTWKQVFASITNCDLFITAVTRETLVSSTCEIEYQYARSLNKNILAVLLEDLGNENLPDIKVKGLVDMRVNTPDRQAALAEAIAKLPTPIPPPDMITPSANWVTPLAELRKRIENLSRDAREQRAVVLNLKEFLERRESFEVARSLLDLLSAQPDLRQQTIGEIEYIRGELYRSRAATVSARRRRTLVNAIILSAFVALIAVILSQLFFRVRTNYTAEMALTRTSDANALIVASSASATAAISALTGTPLPTVEWTPTLAATSTPAATEPPAVIAATDTLAPTMTVTVTVLLSTNTPVPPTATATHTITPSPQPATYEGITLDESTLGLRVSAVGPSAQAAGVQVGDYLVSVDSQNVVSREQFQELMQAHNPSSRVTLQVRRAYGIFNITVVLGTGDFASATPTS